MKWTSRYIDLFKFDQMRPEYLKLNPDGVVPTLVHDGKPIRESTIINDSSWQILLQKSGKKKEACLSVGP